MTLMRDLKTTVSGVDLSRMAYPIRRALAGWRLIACLLVLVAGAIASPGIASAQTQSTQADAPLVHDTQPVVYDQLFHLAGLAHPNAEIRVFHQSIQVLSTTANSTGEFAASILLAPGDNRLWVETTSPVGFHSKSNIVATRFLPGRLAPASSVTVAKFLPDPPVLESVPGSSVSNPITVEGTTAPGAEVRFFVNGRYTRSVLADTGGQFSTWVPLEDGSNSIYATADDGSGQTAASNSVETAFSNTLSRAVVGPINVPTVWTRGDGSPYGVDADLTISSTGDLWIQPGVNVLFGAGRRMTVQGELTVAGTSAHRVVFKSSKASPAKGDWVGLIVLAGGTAQIDYASVEWATNAVNFSGAGADGTVRNSVLTNSSNAGIYVGPRASPAIDGGNRITGNKYGVQAMGENLTASGAGNPTPVVRNNAIYGNSSYEYFTDDFGPASSVTTVLDATRNWWGTADPVAIAAEIYDIKDASTWRPRIRWYGFLESENGPEAFHLSDLRTSPFKIKPLLGESTEVRFTLNTASRARVDIIEEATGAIVYSEEHDYPEHGEHSIVWEGRTNAGQLVSGSLYYAAVTATKDSQQISLSPDAPTGEGAGSGSVPSSYDPYTNNFWKMNYTLGSTPMLVRMRVTPSGEAPFYPVDWQPYSPGSTYVYWDGRYPNGALVTKSVSIYFFPPRFLRPSAILVEGQRPTITGTGASPNIEVKSDPYLITHSYEHISRIAFRLDMNSFVTAKLLPPGVYDPSDPRALTMIQHELRQAQDESGQLIDHVIEWRGYEPQDPNKLLTGQEEGPYTFTIEAEGEVSGVTTLYRGVLNIRQ